MGYFEKITERGHEQVVFCHDKDSGLKAIIAIHSTVLGPALGGCRMWPYKSEAEALEDVLRLSRGMTYKNAVAGLNIGGGKAVIIGDSHTEKNEAIFRAFGQFVQTLGGRYITAEDVGTSVEDMEYIALETDYVTGLSQEGGGSGDPSPFTALGVFEGIKASVKYKLGKESLKGLKVAVQGCGNVGYALCKLLHNEGVNLIVSDIIPQRVEKVVKDFKAKSVTGEAIFGVNAEVFAPCALGAVINSNTIPLMNFNIIAGAANNQLLEEELHCQQLTEKGILYAPDYIINAGGVTNVYFEVINEYSEAKVIRKVKNIYNTMEQIFSTSENEKISTVKAAERLAERRIEIIGKLHQKYKA